MNNYPMQKSASNPRYGDTSSVLDILYEAYSEHNYVLTDEMKEGMHELYLLMANVPPDTVEAVMCRVCALCCTHEYAGFAGGVQTGIQLYHELNA